jgi:hypothetical protein
MQAEGGFGSRQFDIGCLDSVIEFGPQSFADTKTTRPASGFSQSFSIGTTQSCFSFSQNCSPLKWQ